MTPSPYSTVRIDRATWQKLHELADRFHRTMGGQISWMTEKELQQCQFDPEPVPPAAPCLEPATD